MTNFSLIAASQPESLGWWAQQWHDFWRGSIGAWIITRGLRIVMLVIAAMLIARFVGWLTHLFNEVQHLRHGVAFPAFETAVVPTGARTGEAALAAGDPVVVRSSAEIRSTLDDRFMHRGLWFEPDMLKHCGRRLVVEANVSKLIDVVTGEMRPMKTPAFRLQDVHFSGERQLFNAQYEPLLWRSAWLRRDDE